MCFNWSLYRSTSIVIAGAIALAGCGPRMNIVTSTNLGLHATPGDGSTQPPQVSIAYKRSEVAVIPAGGGGGIDASKSGNPEAVDRDLFSAITAYGFQTQWFGKTALDSVIATGHAARTISSPPVPQPQPSPATAAALSHSVGDTAVGDGGQGRASFIDALKSVTK